MDCFHHSLPANGVIIFIYIYIYIYICRQRAARSHHSLQTLFEVSTFLQSCVSLKKSSEVFLDPFPG